MFKLQFFDGSFNILNESTMSHMSRVGLTEFELIVFARKNCGVDKWTIEKKINEMRKTEPQIIGKTKIWEIEL